MQNWQAITCITDSPKCLVYRLFKKEFVFEKYLNILPGNLCKILCKYRTTNHMLCVHIEKGRHLHIDRNQRTCHRSVRQSLGDEFYYLFECRFLTESRKKFIDNHFTSHAYIFTLNRLMNSNNYHSLLRLALFCKTIISNFK